jgi:hypothetical protein
METRDTANELSKRLAINLEAPVAGVMDRVLTSVKPYREFIVLIATLAGAGIGLHDYFITRLEVRVLNCRSLAQIQALESRMEMESLRPQVARALVMQPPPLTKAPLQSLTPQEQAAVEDYIQGQGIINRNHSASNAIDEARARLKPGKCEALVKENKDT